MKPFATALIGLQSFLRPAGGKLPGGCLLPGLRLPPHLGYLGRAMTFGERPECGAGLDGLQLLRIANQATLAPACSATKYAACLLGDLDGGEIAIADLPLGAYSDGEYLFDTRKI